MKTARLIVFFAVLISCNERSKEEIDFEKDTGMSSNEFYDFMNTVYLRRLDTISNNHEKILYANAGKPIKILFEMGIPTIQPPPGIIASDAKFVLDSTKLSSFRIIRRDLYKKWTPKYEQTDCDGFNQKIGKYVAIIRLPWFNPADETLLLWEVIERCPLGYHGPSHIWYRFKRVNGQWISID
jgi:hypothetical protein